MEAHERQVRIYRTADGATPFLDWLNALRDQRAKQKIDARLARIRLGNLGNTRPVGNGIQELKIDCGPGYRVYFAHDGPDIVLLLCGGDKSTQPQDIRGAQQYWTAYKREKPHANG